MASATGIPQQNPAAQGLAEDEPLLGRAGDASQQADKPLYHNLWLGTAVIAQAGIWILTALVWASVFQAPIALFSAHPLLNSAGILFITEAVLVLQPTHTPTQKKQGTWVHAGLNDIGVLALAGGLIVIVYNKAAHNGAHFQSPHAILGLITYILFFIQATIGFTQYFVPQLYGGMNNAKKVWKYHRMAGYVILTSSFATVAAATQTDFNKNTLGINLWAVVVAAAISLVGLLPRIKKQKLGF